jgi:SH3 domain protein
MSWRIIRWNRYPIRRQAANISHNQIAEGCLRAPASAMRPRSTMLKPMLLLCCLCLPTWVGAETVRYVTDVLTVPLRAKPGTGTKITKMLPSGARLQVLEENRKAGLSLVRTDDGQRGWVATKDLVDTPGSQQKVIQLEKTLAEMRAENERFKQDLFKLTPDSGNAAFRFSQLIDENRRLHEEKESLYQELARIRKLNESQMTLDEQNRVLQERAVSLERDLQIVRQEHQALKDSRENTLFLLGVGVLLAGLLLGWMLPGRSTRQEPWSRL